MDEGRRDERPREAAEGDARRLAWALMDLYVGVKALMTDEERDAEDGGREPPGPRSEAWLAAGHLRRAAGSVNEAAEALKRLEDHDAECSEIVRQVWNAA